MIQVIENRFDHSSILLTWNQPDYNMMAHLIFVGRVNKFKKPDGKDGKFDKNQENPAPVEKKDWNKFKQEKKDLKKTRKATKYNFDKMHDAKQLYEKLKW